MLPRPSSQSHIVQQPRDIFSRAFVRVLQLLLLLHKYSAMNASLVTQMRGGGGVEGSWSGFFGASNPLFDMAFVVPALRMQKKQCLGFFSALLDKNQFS